MTPELTPRKREAPPFSFYVVALLAFSAVAGLGAALAERPAAFQVFALYFAAQLALFGMAWALDRRSGLLLGAVVGSCTTSAMHALYELHWYTGPNSMPFFLYLFIAVPAMAIGLLAATCTVRYSFAAGYWRSAALTAAFLLPPAVFFAHASV